MRQHELAVLRGLLSGSSNSSPRSTRSVSAMAMALRSPWPNTRPWPRVNCGGFGGAAGKVGNQLAVGQHHLANLDGKAQLVGHDLHRHRPHADLAGKGGVGAAALRRVAHAQHPAFVGAGQHLQAAARCARAGGPGARVMSAARGRRCWARRAPTGLGGSARQSGCQRRVPVGRQVRLRRRGHWGCLVWPAQSRAGAGCSRRWAPAAGRRAGL